VWDLLLGVEPVVWFPEEFGLKKGKFNFQCLNVILSNQEFIQILNSKTKCNFNNYCGFSGPSLKILL
jgi:hypothetical protein